MYDCMCEPATRPVIYTGDMRNNLFLDLNNIPYLVAEYVDTRELYPIDHDILRNEIFVDQNAMDNMRSIVTINISDFDTRPDGYPYTFGNNTKYNKLLKLIPPVANELNHKFEVLMPGMVMRIDYQLEDYNTGYTVRSLCEEILIPDRKYGYYINPSDPCDNAILSNFCDNVITTVADYTHGRKPLTMRITGISMYYRVIDRELHSGVKKQNGHKHKNPQYDYYFHHKDYQSEHIFGENGYAYNPSECYHNNNIMPPTWSMYSPYYHFDNNGRHIVLHYDSIKNPITRFREIPCGKCNVSRTFRVYPGQRVIFKINVWKNDITIVQNTQDVARALGAPIGYDCKPMPQPNFGTDLIHSNHCHCDNKFNMLPYTPQYNPWGSMGEPPYSNGGTNPYTLQMRSILEEHERLKKEIHEAKHLNEQQTKIINSNNRKVNELIKTINTLMESIKGEHEDVELPDALKEDVQEIKNKPNYTPTLPPHHHHHRPDNPLKEIERLMKIIDELNKQLSENADCDHEEINKQITDILGEIEDIRTNGVDEAAAKRIEELNEAIKILQEALEAAAENAPQPMPDEEIDELINKINES